MAWYTSKEMIDGGVCLDSLRYKEPVSCMFYPFLKGHGISATEHFENFYKVFPIRVLNKLAEWGINYELQDIPLSRATNCKGLAIYHNQTPLKMLNAKQVHWAINMPRFFSERCARYAAVRYLNDKFNLEITEMESYILGHSVTAEAGRTNPFAYIFSEVPHDQTMLNGYTQAQDLDAILSRLHDLDNPFSSTETLATSGYVYWSNIPTKSYSTKKDRDEFRKLLIFEPVSTASLKETSKLAFNIQKAAHILRPYLNKWEKGNE